MAGNRNVREEYLKITLKQINMSEDICDINSDVVKILESLTAVPTTTFHENEVLREVKKYSKRLEDSNRKIRSYQDFYGNLIVHYESGNKDAKSVALVAHTDHPGFEVTKVRDRKSLEADVYGGINTDASVGTSVSIISNGTKIPGNILSIDKNEESAYSGYKAIMNYDSEVSPKKEDFVTFNLKPFEIKDNKIYGLSLDDLAGCSISLAVLDEIQKMNLPIDVYSVFTRAEEIGLMGAYSVIKQGLIPKTTIAVSIETSKQLPGATINNGAVIREGDKKFMFDEKSTEYLERAKELLEKSGFRYQKRRMDAGGCEGSVFYAHLYPTTGLALPLLYWHNGFGEDKIAEEQIGVYDLNSAVFLLKTAINTISDSEYVNREISDDVEKENFRNRMSQLFDKVEEKLIKNK